MSQKTRRWSKFWWQDYERDPALRACSLAAQGLWMRMLCFMHEGEPYGHLIVNGRVPDAKRLAALVGKPEKEVAKALAELEDAGVFSTTENGTIYSRRLVRDKAASDTGKETGATGGNPSLNPKPNGEGGGGGLTPPGTPQEAEAEAEERKKDSVPNGTDAEPASRPPSSRDLVWSQGVPILAALTGKSPPSCRSLLGKMLRDLRDDCPKLLLVLQQAQEARPLEPLAWLNAATKPRDQKASRDERILRAAGLWDDGPILDHEPMRGLLQ